MLNDNELGYSPSFYNDNWTVLQKIIFLTKWCKENTIDINSINFASTTPDSQGNYTITVTGKNYKGESITLGTIPAYSGKDGADGKDGTNGVDGKSIVNITLNGTAQEDGYTISDEIVRFSDGTQTTMTVKTKNGAPGADGTNGTDGKSILSISINGTAQQDGFTLTNERVIFSDGTETSFIVQAKNGTDGTNGTGGVLYKHSIPFSTQSSDFAEMDFNLTIISKNSFKYLVWQNILNDTQIISISGHDALYGGVILGMTPFYNGSNSVIRIWYAVDNDVSGNREIDFEDFNTNQTITDSVTTI